MNKKKNISRRKFQLYELLHHASQDASILVTQDDWMRIETDINELWPDFSRKLYECGIHLSNIELRICWLTRIHIPPKDMATILRRSKPAISLARARLYEKFNGTKGNGRMFDAFIQRL